MNAIGLRAASIAAAACLSSGTAHAGTPADAASVAKLACATASAPRQAGDIDHGGGVWRALPLDRLAFYLVTSTGQVVGPETALQLVDALAVDPEAAGAEDLWETVDHFQAEVAAGKVGAVVAFTSEGKPIERLAVNEDSLWLNAPGSKPYCLVPGLSPSRIAGAPAAGDTPPAPVELRLRGTVDALTAEGPERLSAESASFSFNRVRAYLEDGSRKQTTTYAIKAVAGIPIPVAPVGSGGGLIAYAGYEYNRERVKPAPVLTPPATQADSDTDVLKLGLIGHKVVDLSGGFNRTSIDLALDGGYLFDFAKNAERFRARSSAGFYHGDGLFGLCGLGDYKQFEGSKLSTRCEAQAIADINVLTKKGALELLGTETFGHMGGKVSFEAFHGDTVVDGAFLSAEYWYLKRIGGDAAFVPNIRRHVMKLGYRWWNADSFALEIKAQLTDGINPESFADENNLSLGFGIVF